MCFATKKTGLSIFIAIVIALGAYVHAEGKDYGVIEKVSTYREGNTSVVLIELAGHSTYKVIHVEDNEMLIAFRDTELSSQVYISETILGDDLIKGLEVVERPFHVASVLVKTYKPYEQIECQIKEDGERFRIEMRHRLKTSVKGSQQTFSMPLPRRSDPGPGENGNSRAQKKVEESLALKDCATEDCPLFLKAKECYRAGKWDKALVIFEKIIRVYPRSRHLEESYFLMAKSFHDKFKDEMADHLLEITERYQTAMNKFPESNHVVDALLSMGKCFFHVGQYYEATTYFDLAIKKGKDRQVMAETLFYRGKIFALTKNPLMALRCLEKVDQEYSESKYAQEAKLEIAKTLYQMKSFKRSLGVLSEFVTMRPDSIYKNPDILLYEGYNYYELGRLKEARDVFSKVVNYFPEMESTDLILTRIADTFREDGMEARATKLYSLVARTYPDSEAGLISLLRLGEGAEQAENEKPPLLDEKRPVDAKSPGKGERKPGEERSKEAAEIYEQIIKRYPDNPLSQVAILKLASLHKKNKEYSKCIESLEKLLAKDPKTKLRDKVEHVIQEAMLKLATVQRKEGNCEESVMTLKTILLDYPRTNLREEVKEGLSKSLVAVLEKKEITGGAEAVINYHESLKDKLPFEAMPNVLLQLGSAYKKLHLYGYAESVFMKARKFYTEKDLPADLLLALGECSYKGKNFDNAQDVLKAFISKYPTHRQAPRAHFWLGNIFLKKKEYNKALKSLKLAINQNLDKESYGKALIATAEALNGRGDYKGAVKPLKEAVILLGNGDSSASEDMFIAYRELGETYLNLGQKERAVGAFESALQLRPEGSDAYDLQFQIAKCYQAISPAKAENMLNRIVSSGDPFWSNVAQARINEIKMKESVDKFGFNKS